MLHTARILALKDLRLFFRDRTAVLLTFLLPMVLGTVFGSAMQGMGGGGGGGGEAPKVDLALEDRDGSDASRALTAALVGAKGLDVDVVDDARRLVANGKKPCGIVIPAGYGAGVAAGRAQDLALLRDPSQAISQQVVLFQLAPVLLERQVDTLGAGLMGRVLDLIEFPAAGRERADAALRESYTRIEDVIEDLGLSVPATSGAGTTAAQSTGDAPLDAAGFDPLQELPKFLGLVSEDVAGQDKSGVARKAGASHAFAAMAVMMLLFSVAGAGGTLLQERTEGTLTRLQLTPAAGNAVLLGKLLSVGAIALAQLVMLFAYGAIVFGVPVLDSPAALTLVSIAWAFLAVGIGLTFAVLCSTQKQLEGISTLVILVMSAVGGAWFPREITPEWFRTVGSVTPVAWAMDAYHGVLWYGKGLVATSELGSVLPSVGLMIAVGCVLAFISFRAYRRRFARA